MVCRLCNEDKQLNAFSGGRKVCRVCRCGKQRNPETVRKNSLRAWRKRYGQDKESWNERARLYRLKRKEEGRPIIRNCKSDKYRIMGRIKFIIRAEVFAEYGSSCMYCLKPADTIDHVVPLVLGGNNEIDNLVPACWSCNSSKQGKPLLSWMAGRVG